MTDERNETIQRRVNFQTPCEVLTAEEAAWRLGFSVHEIPILVAGNLLQPVEQASHSTPEHFSAETVENLRRDNKWHDTAAHAVMQHWKFKNSEMQNSTNTRQPASSQT